MTKSEIFKNAHKLARVLVTKVCDYAYAFKLALLKVYADLKANANALVELANAMAKNEPTKARPHFDDVKHLAKFLREFLASQGYNSKQINVRIKNELTVMLIIKDESINFNIIAAYTNHLHYNPISADVKWHWQ